MNKFLLAALSASVVAFFLGWLIYGILLMDFMTGNSGLSVELQNQIHKPEEEMNWILLILGNITWGLLITYVIHLSGKASAASGAMMGAVTGLLVALTFDLHFLAFTYIMTPV